MSRVPIQRRHVREIKDHHADRRRETLGPEHEVWKPLHVAAAVAVATEVKHRERFRQPHIGADELGRLDLRDGACVMS